MSGSRRTAALADLLELGQSRLDAATHGDLPRWQAALRTLPDIVPTSLDLNTDTLCVGRPEDVDATQAGVIEAALRELHPWRKGPFDLFGIHIDTEWRSDWKWNRLRGHIAPLDGRRVLDVGCGSGYHCWRMAGAGAAQVIGIDPTLLYVMQYQAVQHFVQDTRVHVLPLSSDDLPPKLAAFDTVFSMGVLYHRRAPLDHLFELRECLVPGGELVLETLVIEGGPGEVLVPDDRYAAMRNVWFIPSVAELVRWMQRCGYENVRAVDVSVTTVNEQRTTDWMRFNSLADFLDADDATRTIEGHPAPRRAIVLGNKLA